MKCNRCLFTTDMPGVTIGEKGQCNFCDLHDGIEKGITTNIDAVVKEIKKRNKGNRYDCILGISGGFDSSYLLHKIVELGLNPLVVHFDNGWNGVDADNNMKVMVEKTGVDFIRFSIDNKKLNELNIAFLRAGVTDADIPNDMAMSAMFFDIAEKYKIKSIINGHNYKYEGSCPLGWTYMDAKYIESVAKAHYVDISFYPLLTFKKQLQLMWKGYKTYRLLYYIDHDKEAEKLMLKEKYGWIDYGGNHGENIYTEFVGNFLLPKKFGINKKIIYESAKMRSGIETSGNIDVPEFTKLDMIEERLGLSINEIMSYPVMPRDKYETYHKSFKKWRWLIYIGVKLNCFPLTFYKKYCS